MSDEPKREAQKSAPIEITIRLDPSSVVSAGKAAAEAARDTAKSISEAIVAARGPIIVVLSLALAVGVAGTTGSGKPLGIVVAGWIVYGATRLKAAFFPLSPDDEPTPPPETAADLFRRIGQMPEPERILKWDHAKRTRSGYGVSAKGYKSGFQRPCSSGETQ